MCPCSVACQHFQTAAGMFAALSVLVEDAPGEEVPPDSTVNCCKLLESLMLAQAQECILHKVLLGAKRSGLVPRVAMQVADLYDAVHTVNIAVCIAIFGSYTQ